MKNQLLWEQLRAPELKKLAEKNAVVMIPMGAVEQHGPHLPVATDTIPVSYTHLIFASLIICCRQQLLPEFYFYCTPAQRTHPDVPPPSLAYRGRPVP